MDSDNCLLTVTGKNGQTQTIQLTCQFDLIIFMLVTQQRYSRRVFGLVGYNQPSEMKECPLATLQGSSGRLVRDWGRSVGL